VGRRNEGEEQLPSDATEMQEALHACNVLNFSIFVLGWVKHASSNELGSPGLLFLILDLLEELCKGLCLLLALDIGHDVDDLE